jgi:hypothetical protein
MSYAPNMETQAPPAVEMSAAAEALLREAKVFHSFSVDMFQSDSVMLRQVCSDEPGSLSALDERMGDSQDKAPEAIYSIAMDASNPDEASFTIIEARPGEGRDIIDWSAGIGLVATYDAQNCLRKVRSLTNEEHEEYAVALTNFLRDEQLLGSRVVEMREARHRAEVSLGAFMIQPQIEVDDHQGGKSTVQLEIGSDKYDRMVREMQDRIDKTGFRTWPPQRVEKHVAPVSASEPAPKTAEPTQKTPVLQLV